MQSHTPTPWIAQEMPAGCNDRITADDGEGRTICEFPYGLDANAAFIVRAVNAHDDLVKALSDLVQISEIAVGFGVMRADADGPLPTAQRLLAALAKAGAA